MLLGARYEPVTFDSAENGGPGRAVGQIGDCSSRGVVAGIMVRSALRHLAASIADRSPRVLAVSGPAGYRKSALLRAVGERIGTFVICDLPVGGDAFDIARPVLEALVSRDRLRAARSAAGRLALPPNLVSATTREALRREWPLATVPELFILRDVSGALATPAGLDLVDELISGLPALRTLAVTTRMPLPPALVQIVERESLITVGPDDLSLGPDDVQELARQARLSPEDGSAIYDIGRGWPLVSRLLAGLIGRESRANIELAGTLPTESLLAFAAHRTIAGLDSILRDALAVSAVLRGATQLDLVRVLGDRCDDVLFAQLTGLAFMELDEGRAIVHPDVAGLMHARFGPLVASLYERVLHVLTGDGAYVDAARVALDGGDVQRAAAILDAAPPYTAARVPLGEYERILDRMDRELVTRYPNVWLATIPYRAFSVDRNSYVREAETVYYCLPRLTPPNQRAVVLIHLASAYANVGRCQESDELLDDALRGFAREPSAARATLLTLSATLRGIEGRFTLARALAAEAASISEPDFVFGENQTLHYIDAHEAAFRGRYDRALVMFDELVRRLAREELPLYLAYTATNGAFIAWASGDQVRFERYLGVIEDSLTPGIERGFTPMLEAARGRDPKLDERYPWPVLAAIAHLYRAGEASVDAEALEAARAAAAAADERRDPYAQIFAHAAVYVLDQAARPAEERTLLAVVAGVESPELQDAVRRLVSGQPAGILEPFVRLRVLRDRERREPRLTVELLAARVTRDGERVKLTDKELELMALLACAHGTLSRDRIGETLWEHLDPEEWPNNLKVTLSRLRTKLGVRDAILSANGGYRLAPTIEVDLRRAEAITRELDDGELDDGALDASVRDDLRAIVASYRSGSAARYERFAWMQSALVRIHGVICNAGLGLARDALSGERFDEALAEARAVAEIDPFNESACEVTIRALVARGEIGAAHLEYRRYSAALAAELGASPSERLAMRAGLAG
jgi:DNA-binding SARP family transcriptional activator